MKVHESLYEPRNAATSHSPERRTVSHRHLRNFLACVVESASVPSPEAVMQMLRTGSRFLTHGMACPKQQLLAGAENSIKRHFLGDVWPSVEPAQAQGCVKVRLNMGRWDRLNTPAVATSSQQPTWSPNQKQR